MQALKLPAGAQLLLTSDTAVHEMWALGPNVLAFQFHPELPGTLAHEKIWSAVSANGRLSPQVRNEIILAKKCQVVAITPSGMRPAGRSADIMACKHCSVHQLHMQRNMYDLQEGARSLLRDEVDAPAFCHSLH